jgi:hypothetical protein
MSFLTFPSTPKTFLLFVPVAMLPLHQHNSTVQLYAQSAIPLLLSFYRPGIYTEGLPAFRRRGDGRIVRIATVWKTVLELVTGNVVISEADALTCVVLSDAE